ncbi:MAG TPA: CHAT domain-containing protein [Sinorhizobium sp.]|nr:CHAT domain-containing protein [Sinorhizobium sp.]
MVSIERPDGGPKPASDRVLLRATAPHERFPIPPAHDAADCQPDVHQLCTDASGTLIAAAFEGVNRVDILGADIRKFGGCLTRVLLGENWLLLEQAAGAGEPIELEILIEENEPHLTSLPWEMMCIGEQPLCARKDRKIAITRIVKPEKPVAALGELELPMKVLFVVGRQVDDVLRPGAELIGLLRRLKVPVDSAFKNFQSADLNVRYLNEATPDDIETAVAQWKPAVVHIVCHGEVDPGGAGTQLLLTARQTDGDRESPRIAEPYRCSAKRLLELLSTGGTLPYFVVVNACHTADSAPTVEAQTEQRGSDLAFAAELVRGGIAMAVGMSGEVIDRACQMFTQRFYQTLLQGGSASLAASQGRRAALLGFPDILPTLEWSRPLLFLAQGVSPLIRIKPAPWNANAVAAGYRKLKAPEALCDRYELLQTHEEFRKHKRITAFEVTDAAGGVGKTRLLEEIAAACVFENVIPLIVRNDRENPEPPSNPLEFALQISGAIAEARSHFSVDPQPMTQAVKLAFNMAGITPTPDDIVAYSQQEIALKDYRDTNRTSGAPAKLKMSTVLQIIQADCAALKKDIDAKTGRPFELLVLLDDVHRYAAIAADIIGQSREYGLGTAAMPISLALTYSAACIQGMPLADVLRDRKADIGAISLKAFETDVERRMVFRQLVLSYWKLAPSTRPDKRDNVTFFYEDMSELTEGRPKQFISPQVMAVVKSHRRQNTLVDANFEDLFSKWT